MKKSILSKIKKTNQRRKEKHDYKYKEINLDELFSEWEKQYGDKEKKLPFGMFWAVYRVAGYRLV